MAAATAAAAAAGPVVATRVPPTAAGEPFVVGEGVSTAVATAGSSRSMPATECRRGAVAAICRRCG